MFDLSFKYVVQVYYCLIKDYYHLHNKGIKVN